MSKRTWLVLILVGIIFCLWIKDAQCNVVLKSVVVNPSKTRTQEAVLKVYLPKEVKPENIVDLGDLKIDYDIDKELYYVYKKFELSPGESANRSVEIRDIWVISKTEIDNLSMRAREFVEKLKKTAYFDTAVTLQKDIEEKGEDILESQENAMDALPQTHIAVYRQNEGLLDSIKNSLIELDEMFLKVKLADVGLTKERVSVKTSWWVILAVIISLGIISLVFFVIWHQQAKIVDIKEEAEKSIEAEEPSRVTPEEGEG